VGMKKWRRQAWETNGDDHKVSMESGKKEDNGRSNGHR